VPSRRITRARRVACSRRSCLTPKVNGELGDAQAATDAVEAEVFAGLPMARRRDFYAMTLAAHRRL
jgi:hypothetical protein